MSVFEGQSINEVLGMGSSLSYITDNPNTLMAQGLSGGLGAKLDSENPTKTSAIFNGKSCGVEKAAVAPAVSFAPAPAMSNNI